jgi:glutamate/tyrosine decarboxylase-like PLP-dependent enzyme
MHDHFDHDSLRILQSALEKLESGFENLPNSSAGGASLNKPAQVSRDQQAFESIITQVAARMQNNYPYFHPLYAGQMLKPPHPIARTAYALAMYLNPNNHALDGSRASSPMEKECVEQIAGMFGWSSHLGHLTSGGTMANLEALWVAGQLHPGKKIIASELSHYTHKRISGVLGLEYEPVPCDVAGRMNVPALRERMKRGDVGTVVATVGTTGIGSIDPVHELLELQKEFEFRIQADAAYGGYFTLAENLKPEARRSFDALANVDSIVIDPHKHGLQPYGCGCVLFRDPAVGRFYKHDSPYTYFTSDDLHLGEISLECSRAGASAVALWATMELFPLEPGGAFAKMLEAGRRAALKLHERISSDNRFVPAFAPELDIVVWAVRAKSVSESSLLARRIFDEAAMRDLHLALATLPVKFFKFTHADVQIDQESVICLRSVLMKPEHLAWVDEIWNRLNAATETVLRVKE